MAKRLTTVQRSQYHRSHSLRWWPLLLIAALAAIGYAMIWSVDSPNRQLQVLRTMQLIGGSILLILIWLLAFSRLPWKRRWQVFAFIVVVLALPVMFFRLAGFNGDVAPVFKWRWSLVQERLRNNVEELGDGAAYKALSYPQFLGPTRNAVVMNSHLERDWQKYPPQLLWQRPVGKGWSAFAVANGFAITQEQHEGDETVSCYDVLTGELRWRHRDHTGYASPLTGDGPRATPTLVNGKVYTLGATGVLNCLAVADGALLWNKDILRDNEAKAANWGVSGSPLVLDSLVIVSAGGANGRSLVAYHHKTGDRVWSGGDAPAGYSSPSLAKLLGRSQILIFNQGSIAGHDPTNGKVQWQHDWPGGNPCVSQPLPITGERVLVSSGYGIGSKLFQIVETSNGMQASIVWESNRLKAKFANLVLHGGYVYGLDDGILACLDPETGQRTWKAGRYGHGQVLLVDDLLLIQAENGEVVLVEANPADHNELSRFTALSSKTWNHPALAGDLLLVRNDREAACYRLTLLNQKS